MRSPCSLPARPSPAAAQLLGEVGSAVAAGQRAPVTVEDLRPIDADNPRGAAPQAVLFPLVLTAVAAGVVLVVFGVGAARAARLALLAGFALIAGWPAPRPWPGSGSFRGGVWANGGVLALTAFAVAASVAGIGAVLHGPGLGLAALTIVLVGVLGAGATAPRELLPQFWRLLGGYPAAGSRRGRAPQRRLLRRGGDRRSSCDPRRLPGRRGRPGGRAPADPGAGYRPVMSGVGYRAFRSRHPTGAARASTAHGA